MAGDADLDATLLEGIHGMYHYHLSREGKALCGNARVMRTECRLDSWGFKPGHMSSSYCKECEVRRDAER